MSLGLSLNNALSGLLASQQSIAAISQNIANANNEDYSRQQVRQEAITTGGDIGNGVRIKEISRTVDEFISRTVITKTSNAEMANVVSELYNELQLYIGSPGEENSIDIHVAKFFEDIRKLETTPEEPSLKFNAVNSAVTLATEISALASNIENLRFNADQQLGSSVDNVNFNLRKIHDLNTTLASASTTNKSRNALLDEVDAALKTISKEMNINYFFNNEGAAVVSTANGIPLIEGGLYQLQYTKAPSVDDFVNNSDSSAITVAFVREDGALDTRTSFTLASSGSKESVTTALTGGKIKGLLDVRDKLFPDVLSQIDELAQTISQEVNKIHNNGVSFPPPNVLTGTTLIDPQRDDVWSGNVLIQSLDANGVPTQSPYASKTTGYEPLNLDLGALVDDGGVTGKPKFQTIIDEINSHFGSPSQRVGFNNAAGDPILHNVELVSLSDSIQEDTGSFNFSLEVNNLSASDVTYRVTGVTTSDPSIVVSGVPGATNFTSASGKKSIDSGLNISLDMSNPAVNAGPYTINVAVEVDDGLGGTRTDTISYIVGEAADGLIRDRFAADAVSGAGDANIEVPTTSQNFLTARLVDANGTEIAKNAVTGEYTESGYLQIVGSGDNRFGISEQDSSHNGEDGSGTNATNFGLSHYFGLNNFFKDDGVTQGSAINMAVRADIISEPGKISTAKLGKSPQPTSTGAEQVNSYEISKGNNKAILDMANLVLTAVSFDAAGGLPTSSISISGYAAEILGFNAAVTADAIEDARKEDLLLEGFTDKNDSIRGVNVDEELANIIVFQNAYAANARVINTTRELFDTLMNAF